MVELQSNMTAGQKPKQSTDLPSDNEVVNKVLQGDLRSFEIIMRRYNQRLYRIARGILKDDFEAEDMVQETYLKAYTALTTTNNFDNFSAWLCKIAINESLMRLRKIRQSQCHHDNEDYHNTKLLNPDQQAESGQLRHQLETAIQALPDNFRYVFMLRAVEQLSVIETAESLGINPATVKTRFHRAKNILQTQLNTTIDHSLPKCFEFGGERCNWMVTAVFIRLKQITLQESKSYS